MVLRSLGQCKVVKSSNCWVAGSAVRSILCLFNLSSLTPAFPTIAPTLLRCYVRSLSCNLGCHTVILLVLLVQGTVLRSLGQREVVKCSNRWVVRSAVGSLGQPLVQA